jgi:uncharacterized protein YecE (DUF72 family)
MDFGKLASVDRVDFSLPPEPFQNQPLQQRVSGNNREATCYVGATGYNMKEWVGNWYPAGAKDKEFLRHYGAQFNTIEHNTTHYRIPDYATVDRWRNDTPADFKFCPKIPQTISHSRDLGLQSDQIRIFCDAISRLESKMGCCFLQLPPAFSTANLRLLERFLDQFPPEIPLAVEVRHPTFFNGAPAAESYFQILTDHGTATVITDVAGRRDVCHMRLTSDKVLIRFVGNALHPTDYSRIREWTRRLADWFEAGLPDVYFFTHEPDNILAPELAIHFVQAMQEDFPGVITRGPKAWAPPGGTQGSLFQ